jgi:hypothetical protein
VWTVARPSKHATHVVTHDLSLPEQLTQNAHMAFSAKATTPLPALSARFDLAGLQAAMDANNLPCRESDRFLLRTEKQIEADAAAEKARQQAAPKAKKPEKSFMPLPDASMFDP